MTAQPSHHRPAATITSNSCPRTWWQMSGRYSAGSLLCRLKKLAWSSQLSSSYDLPTWLGWGRVVVQAAAWVRCSRHAKAVCRCQQLRCRARRAAHPTQPTAVPSPHLGRLQAGHLQHKYDALTAAAADGRRCLIGVLRRRLDAARHRRRRCCCWGPASLLLGSLLGLLLVWQALRRLAACLQTAEESASVVAGGTWCLAAAAAMCHGTACGCSGALMHLQACLR